MSIFGTDTSDLILNARYASDSQILFILKRPENRLRDATYDVVTHNDKIKLHLSVSPNGNMTASIKTNGISISNGEVEEEIDYEQVRWAENDNVAVVRTSLPRNHIFENLSAQEVVRAYIEGISYERHAICRGGYSAWHLQAKLLCWQMAKKLNCDLNVLMEMSRTTCPGLENTRPWHMPRIEYFAVEDDSASEINPDAEIDAKIQELNATMQPSCSQIILRPPFMVRTEQVESFDLSPNAAPWAA